MLEKHHQKNKYNFNQTNSKLTHQKWYESFLEGRKVISIEEFESPNLKSEISMHDGSKVTYLYLYEVSTRKGEILDVANLIGNAEVVAMFEDIADKRIETQLILSSDKRMKRPATLH